MILSSAGGRPASARVSAMARLWEPSRTGESSLQNLSFAFKIVRYCGLWRTDGDTKTYTLYSYVVALTFILAYIKITVFCFSAAGDMTLFIETAATVFGIAPSVVGTYIISTFSGKFAEIVEQIRAFISFTHTGQEYWKYEARGYSTFGQRRISVCYLGTGLLSLLSYLLRPVVSHVFFGQDAFLPMRQLAMFDYNSMVSFLIQYLAQIFICPILWGVVLSLDILCFNVIASCSHQLKVLTCMILNVVSTETEKDIVSWENTQNEGHLDQSNRSMEYVDITSNKYVDVITCSAYFVSVPQRILFSEEQRSMEKSLSTLSEWHQDILRSAEETRKLLNAVMLNHYLFTSITLCILTYGVQNYPGQSQLISSSSILLFVFSRILILGWCSSELANESLLVADAAYFCKWYDLSLNAKKTLTIMMARSQRPVIIKAGPTGSLSLETCKKLLEAAYSYLNVLNNMK